MAKAWLNSNLALLLIFFSSLATAPAINSNPAEVRGSLDPDFARFIRDKAALENQLAEKHSLSVNPEISAFFDSATRGDWPGTSNLFHQIEAGTGRSQNGEHRVPIALWAPVQDTFGAYEQFHSWNPRLLHRFGNTIIKSIPHGSIYLGGTDAGRFIISALCDSHTEAQPFFTVTQNALADASYLDYVRDMYGAKIYVPTPDDSQKAFQQYVNDASERLQKKQLRDGEEVKMSEGRVQVSGVLAVMAINELLVKVIVDQNPSREIYLEESYALEGLYGQSLPNGLVFKINHQPFDQIPSAAIETDRQFWIGECRALVGSAVQNRTSVSNLCVWCERGFLHPESPAFDGDPLYVKDAQAPQYYSQCRSAMAGYYQWWSKKANSSQAANLTNEADFAYRQAVALSPYNPTVVARYADFLLENQRTNDAKILIATVLRIDPLKHMGIDSYQLQNSLKKLKARAKELSVLSEK